MAEDDAWDAGAAGGVEGESVDAGVFAAVAADADEFDFVAAGLDEGEAVVDELGGGVAEMAGEFGAVVITDDGVGAAGGLDEIEEAADVGECGGVVDFVFDPVAGAEDGLGGGGADDVDDSVEDGFPDFADVDVGEVDEGPAVELGGPAVDGEGGANDAEAGVAGEL